MGRLSCAIRFAVGNEGAASLEKKTHVTPVNDAWKAVVSKVVQTSRRGPSLMLWDSKRNERGSANVHWSVEPES